MSARRTTYFNTKYAKRYREKKYAAETPEETKIRKAKQNQYYKSRYDKLTKEEKKEKRNKHKDYYKEYLLIHKFGISLKDYNKLFKKQKGCCSLCDIPQSKLKKALAVDHDHKTGKVRGLLCRHCNLMLGYAKENQTTLKKARFYLKRNS